MRSQRLGDAGPELSSWASAYESIFAVAVDGLVLFDAEGRILRMNPAARALLVDAVGHTPVPTLDVLRCVRVTDVEGAVVPYEQLPMFAALRGETVRGIPLALQRADGRRVWASAGAAPIRASDGTVLGAVLSLGDLSQLRALQEEREELSRMIAHDLRAPLSVILGHAQLLGRDAGLGDALRAGAGAIATSAKRMSTMLDDLVESALLEAGKLRLERVRVDLAAVVRDLVARLAPSANGRIRVEAPEAALPVLADPERIERVFVNLLTNALKYSPPDAEVTVRVGRDREHVTVDVQDHGPGIAPDDLPHVFERYFRATRTCRVEGIGLGLYTARMLAEAHGGAVMVSTECGQGSVFRVRLPCIV